MQIFLNEQTSTRDGGNKETHRQMDGDDVEESPANVTGVVGENYDTVDWEHDVKKQTT